MVYKYRKNILKPSHHFLKSIPNNGKLVTEEQVCYILLVFMGLIPVAAQNTVWEYAILT